MPENKRHQTWDKIFKLIARKYPREILKFVLGESQSFFSSIELDISQKENIAIEWTIDDVDYIAWRNDKKYIINVEAFDNYDSNIAREVFLHNAFLTRHHKANVLSIGVVLDDTVSFQEEIYKVESGNLVCQFSFPLVGLQEKEKIFECPAILPFLLKIDKGNYTEKLRQAIQKDETLRLLSVIILSRKGTPLEEALNMMELNKSHFYQELMEFPAIEEFVMDMVSKAREEERKIYREERKTREKLEQQLLEERKAKEEERKAREEERKAREEEMALLALEMKFPEKALYLLEKVKEIKDKKNLASLQQIIRMAKDIKEIEVYLDNLLKSEVEKC